MPNMQQALKQVQKMQAAMKQVQDELAEKTVQASAGGGAVTMEISGALEVKKVTIDPEVLEDREMLEDLLVAACNEGIKKAQELSAQEMSKVTGNIKIPGLPGGLF
ncbi:MAG TPA: YbaB/EbfC family nucleoid-associated protein [Firmicutes bacterium]|nr:YbaB/EbfC family nucleoid-associated protein [Bacillota bacterium]